MKAAIRNSGGAPGIINRFALFIDKNYFFTLTIIASSKLLKFDRNNYKRLKFNFEVYVNNASKIERVLFFYECVASLNFKLVR